MAILSMERIRLQASAVDKTDAIRQAGALLVDNGCAKPAYIAGMLKRESTMSTYLGNGVAIPHGMHENHADVIQTGISIMQFPDGILWEDDDKAYLVIGIAAIGDGHMDILSNLAEVIEDEEMAELLAQTNDPQFIFDRLTRTPMEV
ncbi:MAG: PTS sugar transporter subunit IIA [Candidatus Promineifilaceae bacterium]